MSAYSKQSQILSLSRGRFLHPQPRDVPFRGDRAGILMKFQIGTVVPQFHLEQWSPGSHESSSKHFLVWSACHVWPSTARTIHYPAA